ncbi:TraL conjugative transposon family protein [Prevotella sp. 10(H)]|uniref:TraL conjugative transposon family protein n=1 Tax=Prevotella sp. 10(H) TaxID=1158294 RepID=UPI00068F4842|nr:TraL conjugative transposon family protein [Prevotella sp. 10(H)]
MKKKINDLSISLRDKIQDKLRYLCALLSPDTRLFIIVLLLLAGTILNFYFMFSTINNWGKSGKADDKEIKQIKVPEILKKEHVDNSNTYEYEEK